MLGRNEVILLTSDSDSSDNDDKEKTKIQQNRKHRNNLRQNVVVEHYSPSGGGANPSLSSYMSESRIASVERWIVSSPFASSATSTTRKSFGIRLEDVEIGPSGKNICSKITFPLHFQLNVSLNCLILPKIALKYFFYKFHVIKTSAALNQVSGLYNFL